MRLGVTAIAVSLSLLGLSVAGEALGAMRKPVDIPAQQLELALQALAKNHDFQVIYRTEIVGPRRSSGVTGHLTAGEALERMLNNTGLTWRYLDDHTVTILPVPARESLKSAPSETSPANRASGSESTRAEEPVRKPASFWDRFRLSQATLPSEQSPEGSANTPNGTGSVKVEEVVVTATRRAQSIRDVPLSISAVTADEIDRRGLFSAADYLRGIPGANQVESGPFGQSIVIRGIETSPESQNFNSGTTTATYFGEAPTTNSAGMAGNSNVDIKLVDIERVEVLRGPQGTAFGSSSLGGAVRTIPVAPKLNELEGKLSANYSATSANGGDNYHFQAIGNLPLLNDKLAVRAVGYQYEDSGFYRNRAGSDAAFRAGLPSGAAALAVDDDDVGAYETIGGRLAAFFQATDDLTFTLSYLAQQSEMDGISIANSGTFDQRLLQVAPQQVRGGRKGGFYDMDIDLANATMEYRFEWADLLATYSHIRSEAGSAFPFAYLGSPLIVSGDAFSEHRENVGEVRLATHLEGAWDFLAGLYYEDVDDGDEETPFQTFYWLGDASSNTFSSTGNPLLGSATDKRTLKQKAVFSEVSWRFLQGFTLTGGARAYEYDRSRRFASSGPLTGTANWRQDVNASGTNFRINLSYKPGTDVMLYGGWSQGFRLGRPQNPLPASLCDRDGNGVIDGTNNSIAATGSLNSDEVDSYELGGKFAFLERRLTVDAAVFHMKWSGMPAGLRAPDAPTGCGLNYLLNAGSAESDGVELQASLQVTDPFRIVFGGSYIDATLKENLPGTTTTAGNQLAGAPRINANLGLEYGFEVGGHPLFVRADSVYIGEFFGGVLETPNSRSGDYLKVDATARLQLTNLAFDLYVRNLFDEDAFTYRRDTSNPLYGARLRPRTVGLQLNYSF
jgi:iron complex outermembrane recepter protein